MSRKKGSSHIQDAGFLKRFSIKVAAWRQEFTLVPPPKQLDEAKLWMSGPVIAGTAQMPRSNATTKAALSCQSTSSTICKKSSKCDSAWIRIWRQSRNCNQLRTLKSRLRKVTVCRGLFSAVEVTRYWVPQKQRALPRLQNAAWWGWTVKQPLNQQQHGQHCSAIHWQPLKLSLLRHFRTRFLPVNADYIKGKHKVCIDRVSKLYKG